GVVDSSGCLGEVVSADEAARSSGGSVSNVDIELDPRLVPNPFQVAVSAPAHGCVKVPGLRPPLPATPTSIPAPLVILNAVRELHGPVGSLDLVYHLYGWGFERGRIDTDFVPVFSGQLPACVTSLMQTLGDFAPRFSYQDSGKVFILGSTAQIDLRF